MNNEIALKDLESLVDEFPNNMQLGKKVREYVWNCLKKHKNPKQLEMNFTKKEINGN